MSVPGTESLRSRASDILLRLGVPLPSGAGVTSRTPVTGGTLFTLPAARESDVDSAVTRAHQAFGSWRTVPAPRRGQLVRRFGELVREHQEELAALVTIEVGKIGSEARGEIQEVIDVCEFAVGLSRQLYGRTIASERPGHRLAETWHPLGVAAVISAFNFPAAVWAWNAAIALVCGDPVVWKPSELTPLTSLACARLLDVAIAELDAPPRLHQLVLGDRAAGQALVDHPLAALVSATGSVRMGREVGPRVAARFGRALLELGGNNAAIVAPSADLTLTTRGVVFAAAGTAGQRCTTLRRVIAHTSVADQLLDRLLDAYARLPVGDPHDPATLVGPLISETAYHAMQSALATAASDGGTVLTGADRVLADEAPDAYYVRPAIVAMPAQTPIVQAETFAPILYVLRYSTLDEAIALHNGVPQGLSSSIFTADQAEAERFLAADGSDCGIANVNIGTSGAEIGGAFGGEKATGGGRESGSDAWRSYMRRSTTTVNYSGDLPLAQNVQFL